MKDDGVGWPIFYNRRELLYLRAEFISLLTVNFHKLLAIFDTILLSLVVEDVSIVPIRALLGLVVGFFGLANEITEPALAISNEIITPRFDAYSS